MLSSALRRSLTAGSSAGSLKLPYFPKVTAIPSERSTSGYVSRVVASPSNLPIVFGKDRYTRWALLDRHETLNALSHDMVKALLPKVKTWSLSKLAQYVIIAPTPGGRGFCAGGDIKALHASGTVGDDRAASFFRDEYTLNHLLGTTEAQVIAIMDGVTMGGGVGISIHGQHRICTDRTVWAMPECAIGFFPDVGALHKLSRLPSHLGLYLALTGHRIKGVDLVHCGIATGYTISEDIPDLIERFPLAANNFSTDEDVAHCLSFLTAPHEEGEFSLEPYMEEIEDHMSRGLDSDLGRGGGLPGIMASLSSSKTPFSQAMLSTLKGLSPLSLSVTVEAYRRAAELNLAGVLVNDFRIGTRLVRHPDFLEGVRATVIDKTGRPKWSSTFDQAGDADVVAPFFDKVDDAQGGDLKLMDPIPKDPLETVFRNANLRDGRVAMASAAYDAAVDVANEARDKKAKRAEGANRDGEEKPGKGRGRGGFRRKNSE